jgi:hypothetical protein
MNKKNKKGVSVEQLDLVFFPDKGEIPEKFPVQFHPVTDVGPVIDVGVDHIAILSLPVKLIPV